MKLRPIQTKGLKTTDYGARAAVHTGEVGGAVQVVLTLSTEDVHGVPSVLCHLKLSPSEAADLGARLIKALPMAAPHEVSDTPAPSCPVCADGGYAIELGSLGRRIHYRCRNCGVDFSNTTED